MKKMDKNREIIVCGGILAVGLTLAALRMFNVTLPSPFIVSTKGLLMPLNNLVLKWLS
ncbi:hypothetical protein D3C81_2313730 [compost metagenome]